MTSYERNRNKPARKRRVSPRNESRKKTRLYTRDALHTLLKRAITTPAQNLLQNSPKLQIPHVSSLGLPLCNFDDCVVTRGGGDAAIAGEQRSVEDLGERHVNRIVRGECRTEHPDPRQEEIMRIAMERKVAKILKRFLPSLLRQCPVADIAAQDLGYFDVEEVRSV
jgi:hypothetical protein